MASSLESLLEKGAPWLNASLPELLKQLNWTAPLELLAVESLTAGKRVRPLLALWAYQERSGEKGRPSQEILKTVWALEFVHVYSLIHDDLPAMDNDDFRRGRPTLHRLWGDGAAILMGDNLLTAAFEILANLPFESSLKIELVRVLAKAAGGAGMVGGQWHDLWATRHGQNTQLTSNALLQIHAQKTGALLGASLVFGVLLGASYTVPLSRTQLNEVYECGVQLGVLFQVVDDLLEKEERMRTEVNSSHVFNVDEQKNLIAKLHLSIRDRGVAYFDSKNLEAVIQTITHRKS